jgi:hypothetical protein
VYSQSEIERTPMSVANPRELAHRAQNGLEVTLLWEPRTNEVSVEVVDRSDESVVRIPVAHRFALDAFHHPYAYALRSKKALDLVA